MLQNLFDNWVIKVLEDQMSGIYDEIQKAMEAHKKRLEAELVESENKVRVVLRIYVSHHSEMRSAICNHLRISAS